MQAGPPACSVFIRDCLYMLEHYSAFMRVSISLRAWHLTDQRESMGATAGVYCQSKIKKRKKQLRPLRSA